MAINCRNEANKHISISIFHQEQHCGKKQVCLMVSLGFYVYIYTISNLQFIDMNINFDKFRLIFVLRFALGRTEKSIKVGCQAAKYGNEMANCD
jgi:hypothetical protein